MKGLRDFALLPYTMSQYTHPRKAATFPDTNRGSKGKPRETTGWTPYPGGDVRSCDRSSTLPLPGQGYFTESVHPYRAGTQIHKDYHAYKGISATASQAYNDAKKHLNNRPREANLNYCQVAGSKFTPSGHKDLAPKSAHAAAEAQRLFRSRNAFSLLKVVLLLTCITEADLRRKFTSNHVGRAYVDKQDYTGHQTQISNLKGTEKRLTKNSQWHLTYSHKVCNWKVNHNIKKHS